MGGRVAMLCMAISLSLVFQTTAKAYEVAEHGGHHAAEAALEELLTAHHCDDSITPEDDHTDEPDSGSAHDQHHHHHADHHTFGLGIEATDTDKRLVLSRLPSAFENTTRAGLSGQGEERPPKA